MTSPTRTPVPRAVWTLGFVSLLMDMSSEMVHGLLPVLLSSVLGASALSIGLIEGVSEALVLVTKTFSGYISDAFGKRKPLVLLGYGLAALTKPLFPMATGISMVVTARLVDRFGKGIRGAPRDALIADVTSGDNRGAAFGLRQSMDTVGAVLGPLIAVVLLSYWVDDIRKVLWVAVIPAFLCVLLIIFGVTEPANTAKAARLPITREGLRRLGRPFWIVAMVGGFLSLARFSEAFLVLRGSQIGMSNAHVPLLMVVMSLVYSLSAYPVGLLADRMSRRGLLALGMIALAIADIALACVMSPTGVYIGVAVWGLHMGLTQGLLSAMVADATPADYRGTGFGVFSLISGLALLVASTVAGFMWDRLGSHLTFETGAALSLVTLLAVALLPAQAAARSR